MSETHSKKRPLFEAFKVIGEGDHADWTKVGAVWENTKGQTLVIKEGLAVSGRIVFMPPREKEAAPEAPSV